MGDKNNYRGLQPWYRGDPLTANKLNQPVDVLNALGGTAPPSQKLENPLNFFKVQAFKVVRVEVDYVVGLTWDTHEKGVDEVKIALPFLLRQKPFDELQERTISLRQLVLTYEYTDNVTRTATNADDEEEDQTIVPSYEEDDIIYAMRGIGGASG